MSDTATPPPPGRRNEQHRCTHCHSRFEVLHRGDPLDTAIEVEVTCPCCGKPHTLSVPKSAQGDVQVEALPGPEPETGTVD